MSQGVNISTKLNHTSVFSSNAEYFSWYRALLLCMEILIVIMIIIGNGLSIIIIIKNKHLQTPFNMYILNLSCVDFLIGFPVMLMMSLYSYEGKWSLGKELCNMLVWLFFILTFESIMSVMTISLDRFWSVTWSEHYRRHRSVKISGIFILISWIYVSIIWTPAYLIDRLKFTNFSYCFWFAGAHFIEAMYLNFLGYYFPLIGILICNGKVFYLLYKRNKQIAPLSNNQVIVQNGAETSTVLIQMESSSSHITVPVTSENYKNEVNHMNSGQIISFRKNRKEKTAFIMLLHILILFIICWTPHYTQFLFSLFYPEYFPPWFIAFSGLIANLNSVFNPILYVISNMQFRDSLKILLNCRN